MTADERADRVNAGHRACNRQFGTYAGFAGDTLDFDCTTLHLWHFTAEEPFYEFGIAAADHQLGSAEASFDVF